MGERPKNERVLHTRIPAALEDEIKRRADALRMPVSNLVRNLLEDSLILVENVAGNVDTFVNQVTRDAVKVAETARREAAEVRAGYIKAQTGLVDPSAPPNSDPSSDLTNDPNNDLNGDAVTDGDAAQPAGSVAASPPSALSRVFAWQPVVTNTLQRCAISGRDIFPGEPSYFGLTGNPVDRIFAAHECVPTAPAITAPATTAPATTTPSPVSAEPASEPSEA